LHDASNENGLDEGMLKDLQKAIQDNPSLNEGRIDEYGKQRTDGQKQYLDNLSSKIKNIRSATSHNKLKQAVTEFLEIQLNTCQVFAFSNEPYVFKATENNKWTSVTKSNEHCNVEFIQELTPSKDGGDTWNLVQTYTEAKNNSDQACKKDYPEYRYNYYGGGISYITEPKCKYIELQ